MGRELSWSIEKAIRPPLRVDAILQDLFTKETDDEANDVSRE